MSEPVDWDAVAPLIDAICEAREVRDDLRAEIAGAREAARELRHVITEARSLPAGIRLRAEGEPGRKGWPPPDDLIERTTRSE